MKRRPVKIHGEASDIPPNTNVTSWLHWFPVRSRTIYAVRDQMMWDFAVAREGRMLADSPGRD